MKAAPGRAQLSNLKNFASPPSSCARATVCRKEIASCFGVTRCRFHPNRGQVRCAKCLKLQHRKFFSRWRQPTCSLYMKHRRNIVAAKVKRFRFLHEKESIE